MCEAERDKIFLLDERRRARITAHAKRVRGDLRRMRTEFRTAWREAHAPKPKYKPPVKVVVSDLGERWAGGAEEAWRAIGAAGRSSISEAIRSGVTCKGRRLWYEGGKPAEAKPRKCKRVLRDDGVIFQSVTAALGVTFATTREYHRAFERLTSAIKRGKPYEGHFYFYADNGRRVA
jgi:hypothetical protein